jgi:glutathione S-transferase
VLRLYDAARCPYCARVRIALADKHVPHETVEIDLDDRPAWLYEKNPTGKVPVIEQGEFVLAESAVIVEYLEDRYPEPPLLPEDPGARALVRLAVHRFDDNLGEAYYALRRGEAGASERLAGCLARLDEAVAHWSYPYGVADIAYAPWLIRTRQLLGVDLARYPALADRLERLSARPSIGAELALVALLP